MNVGSNGMKMWLVDDEPFALKLLARQLAGLGYGDVEPIDQPKDAITRLIGGIDTTDLIFLDLQMPDLDGIEFVRALARIGYHGGLVLVSGEDGRILHAASNLAERHQLRVLGSVSKPVTPEQLRRILDRSVETAPPRTHRLAKAYTADDLRRALATDALVNYYEPKVDLATGELVGVETLVRWRHPTDGVVPPVQFVGLAENSGLIDELTLGVLRRALRQASDWQAAGLDLRVSVNVSMDSLGALDFPDLVAREADRAGVPPARLVLEITESQVMTDPQATLDIVARLRLKRIGLSIDDFGTGHSSLMQLREIPFDELKIDRSFVRGAAEDAEQRAIVEASVDMARKLGMTTVAEGVEERADWEFVKAAGCNLAQGYFIGRAMPSDRFSDWHDAWRDRARELRA